MTNVEIEALQEDRRLLAGDARWLAGNLGRIGSRSRLSRSNLETIGFIQSSDFLHVLFTMSGHPLGRIEGVAEHKMDAVERLGIVGRGWLYYPGGLPGRALVRIRVTPYSEGA